MEWQLLNCSKCQIRLVKLVVGVATQFGSIAMLLLSWLLVVATAPASATADVRLSLREGSIAAQG